MSIKDLLKPVVAMAGGFFYNIVYQKRLNKALTVFCYHDISNTPSEFSRRHNLNVLPAIFDYQIRFIKKNFNIISPEALIRENIPQRAALITFDDGFKTYFTNAIPILMQHNVPSIIFLNMEPIIGGVFFAGLITYLCEKKPDFQDFAKRRISPMTLADKSLFLSCTPDIIDEYRQNGGVSDSEVKEFIGDFANEDDLAQASRNHLVFYGNHLYAHETATNLSDQELWGYFIKNEQLLEKYPNYRKMFSFPFGQPGTCYYPRQVDFLLSQGVKAVFDSSGMINLEYKNCVSRIPLTSFHSSALKTWFGIYHHGFLEIKDQSKVYNG